MTTGGVTYETIKIPSDVQFKQMETAIKGNIMMISAPKINAKWEYSWIPCSFYEPYRITAGWETLHPKKQKFQFNLY